MRKPKSPNRNAGVLHSRLETLLRQRPYFQLPPRKKSDLDVLPLFAQDHKYNCVFPLYVQHNLSSNPTYQSTTPRHSRSYHTIQKSWDLSSQQVALVDCFDRTNQPHLSHHFPRINGIPSSCRKLPLASVGSRYPSAPTTSETFFAKAFTNSARQSSGR